MSSAVSPLKLLYFPLRARAEPIRMVARYVGIPIVDELISFKNWPTQKPLMPKGQLPVLVLEDGTLMPESVDICLYLARHPKATRVLNSNDAQTAILMAAQNRPLSLCNPILNWFAKEEAEPMLATYLDEARGLLGEYNEQLVNTKQKFLAGSGPGVGDLALYQCVSNIDILAPSALKFSMEWDAWKRSCANLPGVYDYLLSRPKTGTGEIGRPGSFAATSALDSKGST